MIRTTLINRISDGLPLSATMEDDKELQEFKNTANTIIKRGLHNGQRLSIEAGTYVYHILTDMNVCYLCLCERQYPSKLAFSFLEDLKREFSSLFGPEVDRAERPFAFIKFESFIQKTKKVYSDSRTQRNVAKLSEDLMSVQAIIKTNIQEVLGRGERLETVSNLSSQLTAESKKYASSAKKLNQMALLRTYGPIAAIIVLVVLIIYIKLF